MKYINYIIIIVFFIQSAVFAGDINFISPVSNFYVDTLDNSKILLFERQKTDADILLKKNIEELKPINAKLVELSVLKQNAIDELNSIKNQKKTTLNKLQQKTDQDYNDQLKQLHLKINKDAPKDLLSIDKKIKSTSKKIQLLINAELLLFQKSFLTLDKNAKLILADKILNIFIKLKLKQPLMFFYYHAWSLFIILMCCVLPADVFFFDAFIILKLTVFGKVPFIIGTALISMILLNLSYKVRKEAIKEFEASPDLFHRYFENLVKVLGKYSVKNKDGSIDLMIKINSPEYFSLIDALSVLNPEIKGAVSYLKQLELQRDEAGFHWIEEKGSTYESQIKDIRNSLAKQKIDKAAEFDHKISEVRGRLRRITKELKEIDDQHAIIKREQSQLLNKISQIESNIQALLKIQKEKVLMKELLVKEIADSIWSLKRVYDNIFDGYERWETEIFNKVDLYIQKTSQQLDENNLKNTDYWKNREKILSNLKQKYLKQFNMGEKRKLWESVLKKLDNARSFADALLVVLEEIKPENNILQSYLQNLLTTVFNDIVSSSLPLEVRKKFDPSIISLFQEALISNGFVQKSA